MDSNLKIVYILMVIFELILIQHLQSTILSRKMKKIKEFEEAQFAIFHKFLSLIFTNIMNDCL